MHSAPPSLTEPDTPGVYVWGGFFFLQVLILTGAGERVPNYYYLNKNSFVYNRLGYSIYICPKIVVNDSFYHL